jgi:hypothetical protein
MRYFLELDKDEVEYLLNIICTAKAVMQRDVSSAIELALLRQELLAEVPGVAERVEEKVSSIGEQVEKEMTS